MSDSGDRILEALRPVLADDEDGEHPAYRGIPVSFLGAVEMIGDDGEPYLVVLRSPDSTPVWRLIGIADYILTDLRATLTRSDDE